MQRRAQVMIIIKGDGMDLEDVIRVGVGGFDDRLALYKFIVSAVFIPNSPRSFELHFSLRLFIVHGLCQDVGFFRGVHYFSNERQANFRGTANSNMHVAVFSW